MTWSRPFPFRFGGGSRRQITDIYEALRAGGGSLLLGEDGTEVDVENRVLARALSVGWRAAQTRACQADPRKLSSDRRRVVFPDGTVAVTSPLERDEAILGLRPSPSATLTQRREAVYQKRAQTGRSDRAALRTIVARIMDPWLITYDLETAGTISPFDASWPGADGSAENPGTASATAWSSDIYFFRVTITMPLGTSQAENDRRRGLLEAALDDVLPAHCTYEVTMA